MASPQPDQFTRLSNELLEAMLVYPFGGLELRIVLAIFRATYGWNKKWAYMSYGFISRITNIDRRCVIRACQNLQEKKVVVIEDGAAKFKTNKIYVQKDYESWVDFPVDNFKKCALTSGSNVTRVVGEMSLSKGFTSGSNVTTTSGSNVTPLNTNKDIVCKESRKDSKSRPVDNSENQKQKISQAIRGREHCITNGDPRDLINALAEIGIDISKAWGALIQARDKRNPPGFLVSVLANPKHAVSDGAMQQAKQEMRKFNF